jgi:hypothetical protein
VTPPSQRRAFPPALDTQSVPTRAMTASEIMMARAVAACPLLKKHRDRAEMRALHARACSPDKAITEREAQRLRNFVIAFQAVIAPTIVELATGATR